LEEIVAETIQNYGTGRRKSATARVFLRPGTGEITVNKRKFEDYFQNETHRMVIRQPLHLTDSVTKFDVLVNVDAAPNISAQALQLEQASPGSVRPGNASRNGLEDHCQLTLVQLPHEADDLLQRVGSHHLAPLFFVYVFGCSPGASFVPSAAWATTSS